MTILGVFLFNRIRTGGDRRYLELMEGLAERGLGVLVLMNTFLDYRPDHFTKLEFPIQYTYRKFPPASYLFKKTLKKNVQIIESVLKKAGGADIIHIHGDTSLKTAVYLKRKFRLPLFYASRCNDIDRVKILRKHRALTLKEYLFSLIYEPVNRSREQQIARYADLVTFQNRTDNDIFIKRTGAVKTVVIPGNIGLPRCTAEWKNKNRSASVETIVYAGSLDKDKGFFDLLKALSLLLQKGIKLRCLALGRNDHSLQAVKTIKKLRLEESVFLEGYRNPFPYYADCDLLVYPTLYDAFPDTILESLHTGCPVIASRIGGIPDILKHEELLFPSGNVSAIADKIEKCIKDREYYQMLRRLCAERTVGFYFDWAEQFENAIRNLLKT